MDLTTLIGDIDENFYQLGLADKTAAKDVHRSVKNMLATPWAPVNKVIEEAAKAVLKNSLLAKTDYYNHLKSYADGLGIQVEEAAYTMLIPEIVSCMTKWAPGFIKGNFGCSSFFMRNEKGEIVHGRILDFPLQGTYDREERAVLYDVKGLPRTLGFGTKGIPYPSITLMTEDGMTLSLHQKFTNVMNTKGLSIFELIFDMLKNAGDKASVLDYLRSHQSITTWCLYMSFKNGDVLGVDVMGKDLYYNELTVPDEGVLYFCNHLENKTINQEEMLPTGFHQYNLMREEMAAKKIQQYLKKKERTDASLIKMMATPFEQKLKKGHYEDYKMDNITPSSLTVMTLNPTAATSLYIDGPAPKLYRDNLLSITEAFTHPQMVELKSKKKEKHVSDDYWQGLHALMEAQHGFDKRDAQSVYHNLQFAVDHLENHPERCVAEFYFLIAQYLYETHPKVLTTLLHDFKKLEGHLPQTLNDHCLLFIGRLERILTNAATIEEDKIKHPKLRSIYNLELKIPKAIFHVTTKNLIVPRIDILDVIYAYSH